MGGIGADRVCLSDRQGGCKAGLPGEGRARVPARPWRLSTSDFTVRVHEATAPCMKWHCMYVRCCLSVRPCPLTVNTYLLT